MSLFGFLRGALRPLAGRERVQWRWLRAPGLRYWLFRDPLDVLIYSVLASERVTHVLSVGSNDGRHNDPLWTFRHFPNLKGLLVEPFEPAFRRLEANYAPWRGRFALAQVAVSSESGDRPFYFLSDVTSAGDELGTLDKGLLRQHATALQRSPDTIRSTLVRCVTFFELCAEHRVDTVQVLLIDAEGQDYRILRSVDLERLGVLLVLFEHSQLSADETLAAHSLLRTAGYDTLTLGGNTVAMSRRAMETAPVRKRAWKLVHG